MVARRSILWVTAAVLLLAASPTLTGGDATQAILEVHPAEGGVRVAWELAGAPGTMSVDAASLREQEIAVDAPIEFATLRARADAMAASQSPAFKLHQAEVVLASRTLRIDEAEFHYSRPAPPRGGPASGWEEIAVHVWTPRTIVASRSYTTPGKIMGVHSEFSDPRPTPAPAGILAPDEAIRRLNREPLPAPAGNLRLSRDVKSWQLRVQLINVGAPYQAGMAQLGPGWRDGTGSFGGAIRSSTRRPRKARGSGSRSRSIPTRAACAWNTSTSTR